MNLETYQAILKFQYPDHVVVAVIPWGTWSISVM